MITLTIDGHKISVPEKSTVLEAARWLGIRIPTLCHVEGLAPQSSCFLCAVQIEGRRQFSPACAMPVAEGMAVTTASDDVRTARRIALELLLSDHAGECVAPCAATCPAGLDIPAFVMGVAREDTRRSMEAIARHLALPASLGRICPRLCEQQCRRCDLDTGLAIGALHRYAAEREADYDPPCAPATAKSAGIIGAGPAGLSAAYFLQQKGHRCVLYDAKPQAGGMLRYGVPDFRLPRPALDSEIAAVARLGAEFRFNQRWGIDFTLADLRARHETVFVAIGAQHAQTLRCPGEEMAISAVDMLDRMSRGNPPAVGEDVVVIGGGNTAVDCARAGFRLGAKRVRMLYRRTRAEMPCLMSEVEEAEHEGVELEFLAAPVRVEAPGVLVCQRMRLGEPDESGRRRPVPEPGSEFTVTCSAIIAATGQAVERDLAERDGLRVSRWGIEADPHTLATSLPGVFAGGDAVLGADLAVRAVAQGRMAAVSMDQYLRGVTVEGEPVQAGIALHPVDDSERAALYRSIEKAERVPYSEESGLNAAQAAAEAHRCMSCGCRKADGCGIRKLATELGADSYRYPGARRRFAQDDSHPEIIYEPGKCIMCDACVRIAAQAREGLGLSIIGRGFDVAVAVPFGEPLSAGLRAVAAQCAASCPTGALALRTARSCDLCAH